MENACEYCRYILSLVSNNNISLACSEYHRKNTLLSAFDERLCFRSQAHSDTCLAEAVNEFVNEYFCDNRLWTSDAKTVLQRVQKQAHELFVTVQYKQTLDYEMTFTLLADCLWLQASKEYYRNDRAVDKVSLLESTGQIRSKSRLFLKGLSRQMDEERHELDVLHHIDKMSWRDQIFPGLCADREAVDARNRYPSYTERRENERKLDRQIDLHSYQYFMMSVTNVRICEMLRRYLND